MVRVYYQNLSLSNNLFSILFSLRSCPWSGIISESLSIKMATTKVRTNKVNIRMHFFMSQFFIPISYTIDMWGKQIHDSINLIYSKGFYYKRINV